MRNIPLHKDLEPVETFFPRFLQGLSICPMIVSDSIAGDYEAGPIVAAATVYEDRPFRWILQYRQNLVNLLGRWWKGSRKPDPNIVHSSRLHSSSFPFLTVPDCAQIEHGLNSGAGQFWDVLFSRLLPAIDVVLDPIEPRFRLVGA